MSSQSSKCIASSLAVTLALILQGCATIFSSGPQQVMVTSSPPGATYQYGPFSGKTPATIEVPRKALASFATFSLDGYETTTVPVVTGVQGSTWWDILFPLGFVVDFATGNANKIETPVITANLSPKAGARTTVAPNPSTSGHGSTGSSANNN